MIARCSVLVAVLVVCWARHDARADESEIFIYSVSLSKETELVWAIKQSRFNAVPAWHAGVEEAPLSPNKAVAIANEYVQQHLGVHGARILWVYLRPIRDESDNRWMYDIDYSTDPPLISEDPRLHVTVAMDGKVIVPEKRPRSDHVRHIK